MTRYEATAKNVEISTTLPGGEEFRHEFKGKPLDVVDDALDAILQRLADDKNIPIRRVKKAKED